MSFAEACGPPGRKSAVSTNVTESLRSNDNNPINPTQETGNAQGSFNDAEVIVVDTQSNVPPIPVQSLLDQQNSNDEVNDLETDRQLPSNNPLVSESGSDADIPLPNDSDLTEKQKKKIRSRKDAPRRWSGAMKGVGGYVAVAGGTVATVAAIGKGAAVGAAIGSVVPGAGTAVGLVVGIAIGAIIALGVGAWAANDPELNAAEKAISALLQKEEDQAGTGITYEQAKWVKEQDPSSIRELMVLWGDDVPNSESRDWIRERVLQEAATNGLQAARELKAKLHRLDVKHDDGQTTTQPLEIALEHYRATRFTDEDLRTLKLMDRREFGHLMSVSASEVPDPADRKRIREAVMFAAVKRSPAAARELRTNLLYLAANSRNQNDAIEIATTNLRVAHQNYLAMNGNRFNAIRNDPRRVAAYRARFLSLVQSGWSRRIPADRMQQLSNEACTWAADLTNQRLNEKHYLYNPFVGGPVVDDNTLSGTRLKYASKGYHLIDADSWWDRKWRSQLKDVADDEVLVIDGHGGPYQHVIGIMGGERDETVLSARDLAQQLAAQGLPRSHTVIRLTSCYAGGVTLRPDNSGDYQAKIRENRDQSDIDTRCFAAQLAIELGNLGYHNIVVGGYPSTVSQASFGGKTITVTDGSNPKQIKASGFCNYYDENGNAVDNPRNPGKAALTDVQKDQMIKERVRNYGH
ncbi:MAG: hypothetical protein AAF637_00290 [Pseudomonadota bacterium]